MPAAPPAISPAAFARCLPFVVFMALLALRGYLPGGLGLDARWIYGAQTLVVAALLAGYWRGYGELARQNLPDARETGWAVVVGIAVFAAWVRLDAPWMQLGEATASFVPLDADGRPVWPLIALRMAGAVLIVPVMEELFWRSFLMRWVQHPGFERVDPQTVGLKAVVVSTFVFMLAHTLWLAAVIAGLAYAWLYRRSGKLWTAVVAHAVTNALLGLWVIWTGRWEFW
ncbi:CAAX prenyl protease-related protein [Pelomonas aquatica]|jgi:CAAX prenyl protease-like protein|uniref:CAAX prenyl protease-related protein n=1 Tax=Pelomonas aquatica TaxID=431058 RepID=A0A9X4R4D7_9BURK|nr:CAAX prenyl protease-related protein [Pelomonas aquatica]MCY4755885.1 CAAX prenyl protease-related protein [Pelomonas aquatica]MDG0863142.1 CAAX prenyl protease-related protein [Pelomonas aquatica]